MRRVDTRTIVFPLSNPVYCKALANLMRELNRYIETSATLILPIFPMFISWLRCDFCHGVDRTVKC
jgi:hypothetical protein